MTSDTQKTSGRLCRIDWNQDPAYKDFVKDQNARHNLSDIVDFNKIGPSEAKKKPFWKRMFGL